jgi:hypothetical protein
MIVKKGNQWVLYNSDGTKVLGRHPSKKAAIAQEVAINISKAKKKGK